MLIPKTIFIYAGFKKLSFLRYMTVKSLSSLNKDWQIMVYKPTIISKEITWKTKENENVYDGKCYFEKIKNLSNVTIVDFDFKELDLTNKLPEVHKSDFLRWYLISNYGGLWCDMDILFHKPLKMFENLVGNKECVYCHLDNSYHTVGFNACIKENKFYKNIWNATKEHYDPNYYQCIGSHLLNKFHDTIEHSKSINIPRTIVYPFTWLDIALIFGEDTIKLPPNNIGIHWFAGSSMSSQYESIINENNFKNYNNILCSKMKELFKIDLP